MAHVFVPYSDKEYEIEGNWESEKGALNLWYPVHGLGLENSSSFDVDERTTKLTRWLGNLGKAPIVEFVPLDLPFTTDSPIMDEEEKYAPQLSGEHLITVWSTYEVMDSNWSNLSCCGKSLLQRCCLIVREVYADHIYQRANIE